MTQPSTNFFGYVTETISKGLATGDLQRQWEASLGNQAIQQGLGKVANVYAEASRATVKLSPFDTAHRAISVMP